MFSVIFPGQGSQIVGMGKEFFDKHEIVKRLFKEGMGWGDLKKMLFEIINQELSPLRQKYDGLMKNPKLVEEILIEGEKKAIIQADIKIKEVREKVGIKPLHG